MPKRIEDEFTSQRVSRQRRYQLRMKRDRRCELCGEPASEGVLCLKHLIKSRERQRKKLGQKRRYHNAMSYRLQGKSPVLARRRRKTSPKGFAKQGAS